MRTCHSPQVVSKITHPQFRKVKIGWNVFKQITAISPHQIAAHLYNPHDDSVQNILINTVVDVFQLTEYDLFKIIEFKRLLKHLTHRSWHAFLEISHSLPQSQSKNILST